MLIIFGLNMKYLISITLILTNLSLVFADAKVDGFFPEKLVKEGFFNNKPDLATKSDTPRFFISREERRLNPNKAPSNNIVVPRQVFRVSSRPVILPNGSITDVWSAGLVNK